MKFTKEVKENWIKALESGKYKQLQNGYRRFEGTDKEQNCCLAVLEKSINGDLHVGFWDEILSTPVAGNLIFINDTTEMDEDCSYQNVLPIIRSLKTVD